MLLRLFTIEFLFLIGQWIVSDWVGQCVLMLISFVVLLNSNDLIKMG